MVSIVRCLKLIVWGRAKRFQLTGWAFYIRSPESRAGASNGFRGGLHQGQCDALRRLCQHNGQPKLVLSALGKAVRACRRCSRCLLPRASTPTMSSRPVCHGGLSPDFGSELRELRAWVGRPLRALADQHPHPAAEAGETATPDAGGRFRQEPCRQTGIGQACTHASWARWLAGRQDW
jgi:hypothetical protein